MTMATNTSTQDEGVLDVVSLFSKSSAKFLHRRQSLRSEMTETSSDASPLLRTKSEPPLQPEDIASMDISEVNRRLAELENAGAPTTNDIRDLLDDYGSLSSSYDESESDDEPEEVIFKVLVVGNARCGKSSLIRQYVSHSFLDEYISTIGADFIEKPIEYSSDLRIKLQLWDIAGQDRFAKLTRAYFREARGAVIVCDLTRENTVEAVDTWKKELDACSMTQSEQRKLPVVLMGNKSDLLTDPMSAIALGVNMQKCVSANGILEWFRVSAKQGDHVDEGFRCLIDRMVSEFYTERKQASPVALPEDSRSQLGDRTDVIRLSDTSRKPASVAGGFKSSGCECN